MACGVPISGGRVGVDRRASGARPPEKLTGNKVGVSIPVGGNPFRVAWVLSLPDLASVESSMSKLLGNADYMKQVESAASFFLRARRRTSVVALTAARP